jgi:acyl carrier protein
MNVNQLNIRKRLIYMSKKVIIVEKIIIEKAMIELDEVLEKTCDIADMLVQNYGIEINDEEFENILNIINR